MSRCIQPRGTRGSLKWIQQAVNSHPHVLDSAILPRLQGAKSISWLSPLAEDAFAEYRDGDFLKRVGIARLVGDLAEFWPRHGPQWDALATSDRADVLLIEAKAHVDEICSPGTAARAMSRRRIEDSLARTATAMKADPKAAWTGAFYQLANRFAHLRFLRSRGIKAWLVLVSFVGDADMRGPASQQEWEAAYRIVLHVMGIRQSTPLLRHVLYVFPDVAEIR
ncbi:MAG TPA: hypothetical protein VHZ29_13170 [Rhizomicrobium sp.]|jgi:hypothetical protein|nr:hypothetical protein [Rhizomicrobium sp.]